MGKDNGSYSILVIEDNPGDFALIEELLTEQISDPMVAHAENFKKASVMLAGEIKFDVILLDLTLPDKSGQLLVTEMLSIANTCPVIILTGYANIEFSIRSISQGISDYLIKDDLNAGALHKSLTYAIERKKAISHLKESEKRYSDLFHLSPQPMWVYELGSMDFLDVNNAAIKQYGYSREEFLQTTVGKISGNEKIDQAGGTGTGPGEWDQLRFQGVCRHQKKDGTIILVELHGNTIQFDGKEAELVLVNDITERIRYIGAIEKQNEKLKEIAWIQSHIVRAPLAKMMGIVHIIKNMDIGPETSELLDHFMRSGAELDAIIKDISKKTERIDIK